MDTVMIPVSLGQMAWWEWGRGPVCISPAGPPVFSSLPCPADAATTISPLLRS